MAPKKKEQQKMSLGAFLNEEKYGGSWADEVEDSFGSQPLPPSSNERRMGGGYSSYGGFGGDRGDRGDRGERGYSSIYDSFPQELPTKPPFTAHLGNLSYDATNETVTEFFEGCDLVSVRIIEDRIEQRPKGFAYAEFNDVEGLKKALTLDGQSFQGRNIRIKIADPPKDRGDRGDRFGDSARDLSSWERKGPLPDLPRSNNDRRPSDFNSERRGPPREREGPVDDGKVRDFGNWERKGPLSPLPQAERPGSRDSSQPRTNEGRNDSISKDRRASPATWGEGRPEGRQDGSRPPRGEFRERPERPERPERAPTAAELDNQWRSNMRPDRQAKSPEQSRDGSEAPPSPAGPAAVPATAGRPRLNLQKRTVSEVPGVTSPNPSGDVKASPFGAARPIDTAAREREVAEKKEQALKEKRDAEEQAKEDRRLAKEAAAQEAEEEEEAAEAEEPIAESTEQPEAAEETADAAADAETEEAGEQSIPVRPKEQVQNPKTRATESGNWRSVSGEGRGARGGYQNVPRGGRGDARGGRGGSQRGRGGYDGPRPPRANGSGPGQARQQADSVPATPVDQEPSTPAATSQDPDGWTTVPSKGRRGQGARA